MKTNPTIKTHFIFTTILLLVAVVIWYLLYQAQFLEYDENIGVLLEAFFVSLGATIALSVMMFKWRHIIKRCIWQTIIFLIIASPVTVAMVVFNYAVFFGAVIKN